VQSLLLFNGNFVNQQAKLFADRVKASAGNDAEAQVRLVYTLALCRPPRDGELQAALRFLRGGAGPESLQAFCLVLFNTNEFVYMN
jgi:hypothetical protein